MRNLIDTYKKCLGLENSKFSEIKHEDAIVAVVYHIETENGTSLVLKICDHPGHYFKELHFLKQLKGIIPVPGVINTVEPSSQVHGAILMQFLPGNLLQPEKLTEALAHEIGAWLAKVHINRASKYGDATDPNALNIDPIKYFTNKFEEGFAECQGNLPDAILKKCHEYYDTHVKFLKDVDGPCIIHRDFRPGNIIVKDNKVQGIIDWASARYGFAEDDFCSLELGEWAMTSSCRSEFLSGYASIRPVPNYQDIMLLLRLNRALAIIGFTIKRGTWNNSSANLYKTNREFINNFINGSKDSI